jgi:hypothetical protein
MISAIRGTTGFQTALRRDGPDLCEDGEGQDRRTDVFRECASRAHR